MKRVIASAIIWMWASALLAGLAALLYCYWEARLVFGIIASVFALIWACVSVRTR